MDASVLWKLSYGMYVIGVNDSGRMTGCIVNTVFQVTSENPTLAVSLNKNNYTYEVLKRDGKLAISIISEQTDPNVISKLGFASGRDKNKFEGLKYKTVDGLPVVEENSCGQVICEVVGNYDVGTHCVFLVKVIDTIKGDGFEPMTYKYYHDVVKGKAPKNAPTYQEEENPNKGKYVCSICGYVHDRDINEEPDDFTCPICGAAKSYFKKVE